MSVQFGRWSFPGRKPATGYWERAEQMLAPYGPDGAGRYSDQSVDIIYRSFHTTRESRREQQPHRLLCGAVLIWDGRLDNREELQREIPGHLPLESSDVEIVATAYDQWSTNCFARLVGDWALSLWDPQERALILAKDFLGGRHLYYARDGEQLVWSTILDPLVLLAGKSFELEEEYIAGWLAHFPAAHLTPYHGIHAVPPSTFLRITPEKEATLRYWDFDARKRIRYARDEEYEEHFRTVFRESVRRRLRSDAPVLAELSGGMDSSSIVCMADQVIACREAPTPRLETISYYDDSEPNWNERPYIEIVEKRRGHAGCHIDLGAKPCAFVPQGWFAHTPSHVVMRSPEADRKFADHLGAVRSRVLLSGIGGDEFTGGVPTPTPELADLAARFQTVAFAERLKAWALVKRQPWIHLLIDVIRRFLPTGRAGAPEILGPPKWLSPAFLRRQRQAMSGYRSRLLLLGPLPSFQENLLTVAALQRQLATSSLPCQPAYESRYPYLDRDLLEFLCAIPRQQLVRPGQRRSLMRRSLAGIVPAELLNRRRKAFAIRKPTIHVAAQIAELASTGAVLLCAELGIVDGRAFLKEPERARRGEEVQAVALMRALQLEFWLRELDRERLLSRRAALRASELPRADGESAPHAGPSLSNPAMSLDFTDLPAGNSHQRKGGENHELREAQDRCRCVRERRDSVLAEGECAGSGQSDDVPHDQRVRS